MLVHPKWKRNKYHLIYLLFPDRLPHELLPKFLLVDAHIVDVQILYIAPNNRSSQLAHPLPEPYNPFHLLAPYITIRLLVQDSIRIFFVFRRLPIDSSFTLLVLYTSAKHALTYIASYADSVPISLLRNIAR